MKLIYFEKLYNYSPLSFILAISILHYLNQYITLNYVYLLMKVFHLL
uniref:Uncharacterized protein n=1 Tax=Grateloupia filicina TaxID=31455 RepID=A0A2S1FXG4_9FLOR|nr:hypothetical protein Grafi_p077 [Grateloupia filicina]AWD77458.1 hypothetical protein Grafi_p077 [Grateloupia filicina]